MKSLVSTVLIVGIVAALASCRTTGAAPVKVKIVAYINVASGCQEPTVRFLKEFASKYPEAVSLEIVDFGREEGLARWRREGFNCQTILVNGSTLFRLGSSSFPRLVILQMPEGVRWTFNDLSAVLMQELKSPGSAIVNEEQAREIARRTPVATGRSRWNGKEVGEVIVGAQTVFRFTAPFNGSSARKRAEQSAAVLKKLLAAGLKASEVTAAPRKENAAGIVIARGKTVAVVTEAEAQPLHKKPTIAAQLWAFNLREALRLLGR